jgi:hypothetical protein
LIVHSGLAAAGAVAGSYLDRKYPAVPEASLS